MLEKTWRVIHDKRLNKFQVTLQWKGKTHHVGYYSNLCDACIARNLYLRKLYGSLAEAWRFLKPRRLGFKRQAGKTKLDVLIEDALKEKENPLNGTPSDADLALLKQFQQLQGKQPTIDDLPLG
jgi:hypothetical protein